jgi:Bacterial SH3 domain
MTSLRGRLAASLRRPKPAAVEPGPSPATPDEEAALPRWLRPSVRAARVASIKIPTPVERRAPLLFPAPFDGAGGAAERLVVRYDRVQLLDRPNDALGMPLGELDTGDEVEVLEREVIWTRIRTPGQREGWLPAMTLAAPDALPLEPEATPLAEPPAAVDTEAGVPALEDLLARAARSRALASAQPPATEPRATPKRTRKPPAQAAHKPAAKGHKARKASHGGSTRKKRR